MKYGNYENESKSMHSIVIGHLEKRRRRWKTLKQSGNGMKLEVSISFCSYYPSNSRNSKRISKMLSISCERKYAKILDATKILVNV